MTRLRVSRVHYPVTALGPGRRLGVWVQGCTLACKGCMSRDTWDVSGGTEMTVGALTRVWRDAVADGADGLTLSGGEPLAQPAGVAAFLAEVAAVRRTAGRDLDILVFTGHEPEEITALERPAGGGPVLEHADVVIAGRYDVRRPTRLIWRGSANQRMIARTALGRARYAPYEHHEPEHAPIQVAVDDGAVWLVGVPPPGRLPALERTLRERGLPIASTTWRPESRT